MNYLSYFYSYFLKKYLFIYSFQRKKGREGERERNIDVREKHQPVASHMHPNQDWTPNPGMCPDWESNWRPLALWDGGQPTEPHWSGPCFISGVGNGIVFFLSFSWYYCTMGAALRQGISACSYWVGPQWRQPCLVTLSSACVVLQKRPRNQTNWNSYCSNCKRS